MKKLNLNNSDCDDKKFQKKHDLNDYDSNDRYYYIHNISNNHNNNHNDDYKNLEEGMNDEVYLDKLQNRGDNYDNDNSYDNNDNDENCNNDNYDIGDDNDEEDYMIADTFSDDEDDSDCDDDYSDDDKNYEDTHNDNIIKKEKNCNETKKLIHTVVNEISIDDR